MAKDEQSELYFGSSARPIAEILMYIAEDKPDAALAWVEKIEAKCLLIAASPENGESKPELGKNVRASFVGRYVIFHRRANDQVDILRVIPGDRHISEL